MRLCFLGGHIEHLIIVIVQKLLVATDRRLRDHLVLAPRSQTQETRRSRPATTGSTPSAIFDEIETAALRIWFVRPNLSASGNLREIE